MDISENAFDPQQTAGQQQQQQQQHQQMLQQQQQSCVPTTMPAGLQQMQCTDFGGQNQQFDGTTTTATTHQLHHHGPLGGPIPLPAPPQHNYDKTPRSNATDNIDFDSLLLQQFSCLGTRDHEDLIEQFHSLMNNQMNKDAARFFLEMSNW